ncbi:MAG: hypothetical protein ABUK01_15860 [Leptospirales bacterium]
MKKLMTIFITIAMTFAVLNCTKKDSLANYMDELGCCTWTENSGGNAFEYTFAKEFYTVMANGKKFGDFTISSIDDEKRVIVIFAKRSKKYKDVWWKVEDENSVSISQMVGGDYYDSLEAAQAAERTGKWMKLKKK